MEFIIMLLLDTITLRPYVFVFFLAYLLGCTLHLGLARAVLFGLAGYAIAWLSEFSSIHTGFPYGSYYYIETTRGREIWVLGVPLMDSLSYVFLAYASYSLALLILAPVRRSGWVVYVLETRELRVSLFTALLAAVLFMYLDIIIDPVALQGHRWFLGQIYGYPEEGVYFGVPLSNFAGWFLTGFGLMLALQKIDAALSTRKLPDYAGYRHRWRYLIGPGLYFGVLLFNLAVTFAIGEQLMAWSGLFIVLLPLLLLVSIVRIKLSIRDAEEEWAAHLRDFPSVAGPRDSVPSPGERLPAA
ncbi:MAG: hypothetical protein A2010_10615 [Nitrospirae bacterium GWD2_57_9]|nr:MAG: hypothetical protein A2010_10615 [Nitrospirae bacterium GWD2_57_9]OGW45327.1 MAG: hypothetical protein A2078_01950 [Nitrospirae bacterium GWC2_57_9]